MPLDPTSLADFALLCEHEINFPTLSEELLEALTEGPDLFVATSALCELGLRRSPRAAALARAILSGALGDRYLQAAALGVLAGADPAGALGFIRAELPTCDAYVFEAMLPILLESLPGYTPEDPTVAAAVSRIQGTAPGEWLDSAATRESFLRARNALTNQRSGRR